MKLQFDKNQSHQLAAIRSVVDLFEGQPLNSSGFEFAGSDSGSGSTVLTAAGTGNQLALSEEELLANLRKVQNTNRLRPDEVSVALEKLWYTEHSDEGGSKTIVAAFPNFSVEMETGTGKTYAYLRTVYELHSVYGFKKFVIVVPSVAIREGVLKSLEITREHFQQLYQRQPAGYGVYDAGNLSCLRNFARSNAIQLLVINIDAFAKDSNVINKVRETGLKPIDYIRNVNPVVLLDEPQNMETDIRKKAIAQLNPLFTLRYSATHKNLYNLVYKLDPVMAHDLGLVKQIEVDSVVAKHDSSGVFISVDGFRVAKKALHARLTIFVQEKSGVQKKQVTARTGDDLYKLSNGWDVYHDGFVLTAVDVEAGAVQFSGGKTVFKGQPLGGLTDQVLREMIDATVENHFRKEKELRQKGIKVLSLFFIDRVANYRTYTDEGREEKGKFARWFEESFTKWHGQPAYSGLFPYSPADVHDGYFSQSKGRLKDSREGKLSNADDETFKLIMQDKERLLDIDTPLRFIFSHSALREGWDNPNVFQICTLNESKSAIRKRQEIGRGLRLCVDQSGTRNTDREVNRLTVVANEAYESFSKALQQELAEDCGVKFEGRIRNARSRVQVKLKEDWQQDVLFLELWDKLKHRTAYRVSYSTEQLIANCATALRAMPAIRQPAIYREKNAANFIRDKTGNLLSLGSDRKSVAEIEVQAAAYEIPDVVTYIQAGTEVTRDTIIRILLQSERLDETFLNPQLFMDTAVRLIKTELDKLKTSGIRYEKMDGHEYGLALFEATAGERYLEDLLPVQQQGKTLYNNIPVDAFNTAERAFALACDAREDILFYIKLPASFRIPTPAGYFTPGWALLKKTAAGGGGSGNSVIVADIVSSEAGKGSPGAYGMERVKRACAQKHFKALTGVQYKVMGSAEEL